MSTQVKIDDLSIGELARLADRIREEKRELERKIKKLGDELEQVKGLILAKLDEQDVDRIAVDGISISKSSNTQPSVEDWDQVYAYIAQHNLFPLLQRRITATLWRELLESGDEVPGITPFVKRDVNIRVS